MIDYRSNPGSFSNVAVIDYSYFEMLYDLLNDSRLISPEMLIGLSIFSEAIVLHEELIPNNFTLKTSSCDEANFLECFLDKKVLHYERFDEKSFIPLENSAASYIDKEMSEFIGNESVSDFCLEHMNFNYKQFVKGWARSIDAHGITEIPGIYNAMFGRIDYNFTYLYNCISKNNKKNSDFLKVIDKVRFESGKELSNALKNTYICLPSIISIVLDRSKDLEDIPNQILLLRDEMSEFRKKYTDLECTLRREKSFKAKLEILNEIKYLSKYFESDIKSNKKRRIVQKTIDLLEPSTNSIITNTVKLTLENLYNSKLELKLASCYDLYKKSIDVEDNIYSLERLFGDEFDYKFTNKLASLTKKTYSFK